MRRPGFIAAVVMILACAGTAFSAEMSIDWGSERQEIVGFGGTMGWVHPSAKNLERVGELLFRDLGASVLRVRALGGETGDEDCPEPVNDNADSSVYAWENFHFARTERLNADIIRTAAKHGVRTIVATAWSPPGWMKDSGSRAGGWFEERNSEELAELWAAYVVAMDREWKISIPFVSIQNEPDLSYPVYPTCGYRPETYVRALEATRARFSRERIRTCVVGPDTCRIYNLPEYKAALDAVGYDGPLLVHLYDLRIPYHRVDQDAPRWRAAREAAGERPLWFMETANYLSGGVSKPGSYDEAFIWAQKMHHALVSGECRAVLYWSLYFDKPGEALIYAGKSGAAKYTLTPKYYTSMHFYRFVRPGMVMVPVRQAPEGVLVSAFRDRGDTGRVVVAINTLAEAVTLSLPPEGYAWECHVTTERRYMRNAGMDVRSGAFVVPPRAVATCVGGRAEGEESTPADPAQDT
ncbi:MAG: hypothetical protein JW909_13515 [Planctomycetes bacterium]|nr:hypothetical protein [Planctomycetota bacterium]